MITYNTPRLARANSLTNIFNDDDNTNYSKPLRFTSAWDPVSMFDYNARVTYKAPNENLDFLVNIANNMQTLQ